MEFGSLGLLQALNWARCERRDPGRHPAALGPQPVPHDKTSPLWVAKPYSSSKECRDAMELYWKQPVAINLRLTMFLSFAECSWYVCCGRCKMIPIRNRLESICVQYLNHGQRARRIDSVALVRPTVGAANWTLGTVEPRLHIRDVAHSHAAIRELQNTFRMVA